MWAPSVPAARPGNETAKTECDRPFNICSAAETSVVFPTPSGPSNAKTAPLLSIWEHPDRLSQLGRHISGPTLRHAPGLKDSAAAKKLCMDVQVFRSEERRVGKEGRSR